MSKDLKDLNISADSLKAIGSKLVSFVTKYRFTAAIAIAAASVIAAILTSGTYLSPPRNDLRYEEEKIKINYSSIDLEVVEKLSATQEDATIEVNGSLVPSRSNPFEE
ncbi:MAG: hypothetical protein ACI9T8_000150 [Candidatus Saccharimonadales bacterium]|jgi:hypothetical protein